MEISGLAMRGALALTQGCPYFGKTQKYKLARINLVKAATPAEVLRDERYARLNDSPYLPIVVEKNRRNYGHVAAMNYSPPAIVVCGAARRSKLLKEGIVKTWAWTEKGALSIQADDCISSEELTGKLQRLLEERFSKVPQSSAVYIVALYPFENYLIYSFGGQKYRLGYNLDPKDRLVSLAGTPTPVKEQFVDAARNLYAETCRSWEKPIEAAAMYLDDVKHGLFRPKRLRADVPAHAGEIFQILASKNISYPDFVRWSFQEQADTTYKSINGQKLPASKFRCLSKEDKSSWEPLIRRAMRND